jgi:DNA-binding transcriptional regulator YiaG
MVSGPEADLVAARGLLIAVVQHSTFRRNSGIHSSMTNIVSGRQLRAARVLAGLTQAELATESGFNPRAAKYWERRENELPTSVPDTLAAIERTLRRHGVEVFERPTPGARLIALRPQGIIDGRV